MEQYQKSFGMTGKGSATGLVFIIYNVCVEIDLTAHRPPPTALTNSDI